VITDALLAFFGQLLEWVLWLLPDAPAGADGLPDNVLSGLALVFGYGADLGAWIPWAVVVPTLAILTAVLVASGSILLVRIVASFFSGGGGSV
jgi:hypothetical protein